LDFTLPTLTRIGLRTYRLMMLKNCTGFNVQLLTEL
jgi:hypothetical protein